MAGHHCCSARAFAVNPSRLPARPSGLPGVDRSARPSKEACRAHQCKTALARAPLETERKEMLIAKKLLDTPGPHISWVNCGKSQIEHIISAAKKPSSMRARS